MTNDTPTIVIYALRRALNRDSHRVHTYLDARGDRAVGKAVSAVGAELLAQEGQCATPEELAKWIDAL